MYTQVQLSKASNKPNYKLTAKYHLKKISAKDIYLLLMNNQKYMLKNNYYLDGKLLTRKTSLSYKKAYINNSKVFLFEVNGKINNKIIKAKEIEYDGKKSYILKFCEVKDKNKIYRRKKLLMLEN